MNEKISSHPTSDCCSDNNNSQGRLLLIFIFPRAVTNFFMLIPLFIYLIEV